MKNTTVKELIEMLKGMNQDAVVCIGYFDAGDAPFYSTAEMCKEVQNATYIDDGGDEVVGDIIYFL
jgi:hypothetical protein